MLLLVTPACYAQNPRIALDMLQGCIELINNHVTDPRPFTGYGMGVSIRSDTSALIGSRSDNGSNHSFESFTLSFSPEKELRTLYIESSNDNRWGAFNRLYVFTPLDRQKVIFTICELSWNDRKYRQDTVLEYSGTYRRARNPQPLFRKRAYRLPIRWLAPDSSARIRSNPVLNFR